jgi:hypothetical protein
MELNGVPNDIIQNLNPISIILFIRKWRKTPFSKSLERDKLLEED